MNIAIVVGHSMLKNGSCTSADGRKYGGCLEYSWCKAFSGNLAHALKKNGHSVTKIICPEKTFMKSIQEKTYKLNNINGKNFDLVIELHLNASNSVLANGCEVLYKSKEGLVYAEKIQSALGDIFKSRGIKYRNDLYMLNATIYPTILLETFFCTNKNDYKKARGKINRIKIAKLIADKI